VLGGMAEAMPFPFSNATNEREDGRPRFVNQQQRRRTEMSAPQKT
jgi:hypothetical protein